MTHVIKYMGKIPLSMEGDFLRGMIVVRFESGKNPPADIVGHTYPIVLVFSTSGIKLLIEMTEDGCKWYKYHCDLSIENVESYRTAGLGAIFDLETIRQEVIGQVMAREKKLRARADSMKVLLDEISGWCFED